MTEKIAGPLGHIPAIIGAIVPVLTLVVYFARIEPKFDEVRTKVDDQHIAQVEIQGSVTKLQSEQSARIDRIEDSRRDGLQRLSRVEEAVASMKDNFIQINTKLDKILFERRR